MKKMMVLIGNYGSGKSELALNFALRAAERGERTELLDLDMVNTYFRLTERGKQVQAGGDEGNPPGLAELRKLRHRDALASGGSPVRFRDGLGHGHL